MRYYALLNNQHIALYIFPTLIFIILLGIFLGFTHFRGRDSEARQTRVLYRFPDGIEDRDAPFPLGMTLVVAGAVLWALLYILGNGVLGVRI